MSKTQTMKIICICGQEMNISFNSKKNDYNPPIGIHVTLSSKNLEEPKIVLDTTCKKCGFKPIVVEVI